MVDPTQRQWTLTESRNDDFVNYARFGESRPSNRENKAFIYPGPYATNIAGPSTKVRRGFIRSIIMGGKIGDVLSPGKTPGNLRLNFQFNPEYIERRVSQSPGAVNPLLQNPTNLTQAVPGTAQFNFTMMFNRETEVARREKDLELGKIITPSQGSGTSRKPISTISITPSSIDTAYADPGQVGVMHDLSIFDKIIGQGISEELISVLSSYTNSQIEQQNALIVENNKKAKQADPAAIDKPMIDVLPADFAATLDKNFGNSAFLNPMPVRIVFSDLFMIEGLVVGSAVAFQKFSQNMIPTICQVNCEVYALYFGFANQQAFLTSNLEAWAATTAATAAAATAAAATAAIKFKSSIEGLKLYINYGPKAGYSEGVRVPLFPETFSYGTNLAYRKLELITIPSGKKEYRLGSGLYSGANGDLNNNWVTFPQWYNTFAGGNSSVNSTTVLAAGNEIQGLIRPLYNNIDFPTPYNTSGKVPFTLELTTRYEGMHVNTKSELTSTIKIKYNGSERSINLGASPGTGWTLISTKDTNNQLVKYYTYSNTFYMQPKQIKTIKEHINADASLSLTASLENTVLVPNTNPSSYVSTGTGISFTYRFDSQNKFFYNSGGSMNIPIQLQIKSPSRAQMEPR